MVNLKYIIENEFFITCPLLPTDQFISYCKDRDIQVTRERLEKFERLGIFYPIARVKYQKIKIKVEYIENGKRYRDFGMLKDGEEWSGDTIEEYSSFKFEKEFAKNWFEEGLLWEPFTKPFEPWEKFLDENRHIQVESFYSIFQCYTLNLLINQITIRIHAESYIDYDENCVKNLTSTLSKFAGDVIPIFQKPAIRDKAVSICQIISNRYFPQTQSDRRAIQVPFNLLTHPKWEWVEYCRNWGTKKVFAEIGISVDELKKLHEVVVMNARFIDPLEKWYGLISFISVAQKKNLKSKALLVQTLYSMEHMLRLFYEEITGDKLPSPDEGGVRPNWKDNVYGEGVTQNELQYLELLVNQYHLNPKPKLILIVEGNGEEEQFPRLADELIGYPFPRLGIEVINIQGVGNFTGEKRLDKYGALERFIDDHHYRQTMVFVVLDNEGRATTVKERLVKRRSKSYPKRRVTKDEYIHIWNNNIELDNFSNDEIARAMTELCERGYIFKAEEIEDCRKIFNSKKGDLLAKFYQEKTGRGPSKPNLLKVLSSFIISNPDNEFDDKGEAKRPVVRIIQKVINLASVNHQPSSRDIWQENQESGYFGDLIEQNETRDLSADS